MTNQNIPLDEKPINTLASMFSMHADLLKGLLETGEVTPEIESMLAHLEIALPEKVDGYHHILSRLEAEMEYFKAKADELYAASKVISNARDRIKEHIKFKMQEQGLSSLEGLDFKFTLSKSKPKVVVQEELIPKEYTREVTEIKIDKDRISEDLKLGIPVPGAHLEDVFALKTSVNKATTRRVKAGA